MKRIAHKLFNWASILEGETRAQAERTALMPFVYPHVALMPDAHLGKGATVGSVIPTLGAIMPAAVGVDIGCGMMAVRTQFTAADLRSQSLRYPDGLGTLRRAIEEVVPSSTGKYNIALSESAEAHCELLYDMAIKRDFHPGSYVGNWRLQLGSLGSGNHFIEVTADEQDRVWLFLHSGSRGIGNRIATRHIKVAQEQCRRRWIDLPDPDLAYLVEGEDEFWAYVREMDWAQEFAYLNRVEMMDRVIGCLVRFMNHHVELMETINCHHNYTVKEHHFGKDVWLSRKGAINAALGIPGLIPGSMGTASYVVTGKGDRFSLNSSPHGAGRNYSRSRARKTFTREQLNDAMTGIEWRPTDAFLDEIPMAYKDIDQVMVDAADLVEVRHTLHQLINVKGD